MVEKRRKRQTLILNLEEATQKLKRILFENCLKLFQFQELVTIWAGSSFHMHSLGIMFQGYSIDFITFNNSHILSKDLSEEISITLSGVDSH